MTHLPRQHRKPPDKTRDRSVLEQQCVTGQKDYRADQMQRLIDAALMIVAVIVPALRLQHFSEATHHGPQCLYSMADP
jgi:hypothetical protein